MHELSICEALVGIVISEYEKLDSENGRLLEARVVAGALRQLVPECMQQAYELFTRDTRIMGSRLVLKILPLTGRCSNCGKLNPVEKWEFMCAGCGADRYEIEGGQELYLESLELEQLQ